MAKRRRRSHLRGAHLSSCHTVKGGSCLCKTPRGKSRFAKQSHCR
jgi:hypothetical protein